MSLIKEKEKEEEEAGSCNKPSQRPIIEPFLERDLIEDDFFRMTVSGTPTRLSVRKDLCQYSLRNKDPILLLKNIETSQEHSLTWTNIDIFPQLNASTIHLELFSQLMTKLTLNEHLHLHSLTLCGNPEHTRKTYLAVNPEVSRSNLHGRHVAQMLLSNSSLTSVDLRLGLEGTTFSHALTYLDDHDQDNPKPHLINQNSTLTELSLSHNSIMALGMKALTTALDAKHWPRCGLRYLDLSHNTLHSDAAEAIATLLETNYTIKTLNLEANKLDDEGCDILAKSFQKVLNQKFPANNTSTSDSISPSIDLPCGGNLTALLLGDNRINDISSLCQALVAHPSLITLGLGLNPINTQGAHDIANFLRGNTTLKALLIPDCGIGSDGCAAIADALSYEENPDSALVDLQLQWNIVGVGARPFAGLTAMGQMLYSNRSLTNLNLFHNSIGADGLRTLLAGLPLNPHSQLTRLCLSNNPLGNAGAQVLAELLQHPGCRLQHLWLSACKFGADAAMCLEQGLRGNHNLFRLDLTRNMLSDPSQTSLRSDRHQEQGTGLVDLLDELWRAEVIRREKAFELKQLQKSESEDKHNNKGVIGWLKHKLSPRPSITANTSNQTNLNHSDPPSLAEALLLRYEDEASWDTQVSVDGKMLRPGADSDPSFHTPLYGSPNHPPNNQYLMAGSENISPLQSLPDSGNMIHDELHIHTPHSSDSDRGIGETKPIALKRSQSPVPYSGLTRVSSLGDLAVVCNIEAVPETQEEEEEEDQDQHDNASPNSPNYPNNPDATLHVTQPQQPNNPNNPKNHQSSEGSETQRGGSENSEIPIPKHVRSSSAGSGWGSLKIQNNNNNKSTKFSLTNSKSFKTKRRSVPLLRTRPNSSNKPAQPMHTLPRSIPQNPGEEREKQREMTLQEALKLSDPDDPDDPDGPDGPDEDRTQLTWHEMLKLPANTPLALGTGGGIGGIGDEDWERHGAGVSDDDDVLSDDNHHNPYPYPVPSFNDSPIPQGTVVGLESERKTKDREMTFREALLELQSPGSDPTPPVLIQVSSMPERGGIGESQGLGGGGGGSNQTLRRFSRNSRNRKEKRSRDDKAKSKRDKRDRTSPTHRSSGVSRSPPTRRRDQRDQSPHAQHEPFKSLFRDALSKSPPKSPQKTPKKSKHRNSVNSVSQQTSHNASPRSMSPLGPVRNTLSPPSSPPLANSPHRSLSPRLLAMGTSLLTFSTSFVNHSAEDKLNLEKSGKKKKSRSQPQSRPRSPSPPLPWSATSHIHAGSEKISSPSSLIPGNVNVNIQRPRTMSRTRRARSITSLNISSNHTLKSLLSSSSSTRSRSKPTTPPLSLSPSPATRFQMNQNQSSSSTNHYHHQFNNHRVTNSGEPRVVQKSTSLKLDRRDRRKKDKHGRLIPGTPPARGQPPLRRWSSQNNTPHEQFLHYHPHRRSSCPNLRKVFIWMALIEAAFQHKTLVDLRLSVHHRVAPPRALIFFLNRKKASQPEAAAMVSAKYCTARCRKIGAFLGDAIPELLLNLRALIAAYYI